MLRESLFNLVTLCEAYVARLDKEALAESPKMHCTAMPDLRRDSRRAPGPAQSRAGHARYAEFLKRSLTMRGWTLTGPQEEQERTAAIIAARNEGVLLRVIGERFGISYQRVQQILRRNTARVTITRSEALRKRRDARTREPKSEVLRLVGRAVGLWLRLPQSASPLRPGVDG